MLMPLPSRLSSTVQVEITFENPVVFAGQPVNAIITFRNPNEPPPAPLDTVNASSQKEDGGQQGQQDDSGEKPFVTPTRTRFNRAMSAASTPPHIEPHNNITKAHPSHSPLAPALPPLSIPQSSGSSNISAASSPLASPLPVINPVDTSFLSDDDSSSPSTPTTQLSWESRLSSHLPNSIRDLYRDTNSSAPDIHNNGPLPRQSPSGSSLSPMDTPLYSTAGTPRWSSRSGRHLQHQLTRSGSTYIQSQKSAKLTHGLLMGYVQLQGYYVLDEELINTEEFAHVKNQGVVVGPNGGIGYKSQSSGGLLQGLASGLGSLLQIRDSDSNSSSEGLGRRVSFGRSSKRSRYSSSRLINGKNDAIPIFSTPQSLLFVDLKLSPGESKSFSYKLELPPSLPPSCRAKSIRIHYNLVIGIQKLDSRGRPQPKTTLVPFRVFPHVDKYGQQYTHDLQTPIVLQKDQASVVQLPSDRYLSSEKIFGKAVADHPDSVENGRASFVSHIEGLFSSDPNVRNQLLSQQIDLQAAPKNRKTTTQDNIDFFCRYHHTFDNVKPMRSRFDIGRAGRRIATVILSKPVYRVGENIVFVVEYANADLKCFHITASLETEEFISQDVLRKREDPGDITRRVYSQSTMSTYSLNKSTFEFAIPATATPQFSTSSIALKWNLKLDFITSPTDASSVAAATDNNSHRTVADDHEAVNASVPKPSTVADGYNNNSRRVGSSSASMSSRRASHYRHRSTSSVSTIATTGAASSRNIEFPDDPRSAMHVLHFNDQGLIAGTKETIACESFHCKIPIMVLPTNQDISALLEHTVSATRVLSM